MILTTHTHNTYTKPTTSWVIQGERKKKELVQFNNLNNETAILYCTTSNTIFIHNFNHCPIKRTSRKEICFLLNDPPAHFMKRKSRGNKRNFQRHIVKCSNNFLFSLWCFWDTFYCTMNFRATAAVKIKYIIMPKSVFTIPSPGRGYKNSVHIDRGWCFFLFNFV